MEIESKRIRWIVDGVSVQEMEQLLRRRGKKEVLVASMKILYAVAGQPGGKISQSGAHGRLFLFRC